MNVTLPRKHQEWLEAQVKAGVYRSVDEALSTIVALRMLRERLELEPARNSIAEPADDPN